MYDYNEFKTNHEVVKEYCHKYRAEITDMQGKVLDKLGMATYSGYTEFMNEMSMDEFIGNNLTCVMNEYVIGMIKQILDGEMEFEEFAELFISNIPETFGCVEEGES